MSAVCGHIDVVLWSAAYLALHISPPRFITIISLSPAPGELSDTCLASRPRPQSPPLPLSVQPRARLGGRGGRGVPLPASPTGRRAAREEGRGLGAPPSLLPGPGNNGAGRRDNWKRDTMGGNREVISRSVEAQAGNRDVCAECGWWTGRCE